MSVSLAIQEKGLGAPLPAGPPRKGQNRFLALGFWAVILLLCNLPLLGGEAARDLAFFPAEVASGEWWRVVTFPFVHVSGYNLLLDASAFLLLWSGLEEESPFRRLLYFGATLLGSLLLPLAFSEALATRGLCGLSGIAHGLMAVSALELLERNPRGSFLFRTGLVLLGGLVAKTVLEVLTGGVLLAVLHLGEVGHPIVESHAGGLLGGLLAYGGLRRAGARGTVSAEEVGS